MSGARSNAIAALERWRSFQEARAAMTRRSAQNECDAARDVFEHSRDRALAAGVQRLALLDAPGLDLPRWQAAAAIETTMWQHTAERGQQHSEARARADEALRLHQQAHLLTEVVVRRRERRDATEQEHKEKVAFDRLAELRAAAQGAHRD